ncbi:MAG: hypothetical protein ISR81_07735 [Nitrosopumilus sp.]|nr:hypothetical protein [Nitrosopumilus sp.]
MAFIPSTFAHEPNFGTDAKTSKDILKLCQFFYEEYQLIDSENFKDHHKLFLNAKICPILYDHMAWKSQHPQKDVVLIFEIEKKLEENSNYLKDKHLNEKSIPKWFEKKAKLWAGYEIKNEEFLNSVEELNGLNFDKQGEIPDWFKQTTKWYLDETISEKEFFNSIKYLIKLHHA